MSANDWLHKMTIVPTIKACLIPPIHWPNFSAETSDIVSGAYVFVYDALQYAQQQLGMGAAPATCRLR